MTEPRRLDPRLRIALGLGVVAAVAGVSWFVAGDPPPADANPPSTPARTWTSSVECRDCHRDTWDEWVGSQHQLSYLNPEVRALSDDFRNKACQACHLPRPVAVTGYEKRTLHRTTLPDEGVSCLTCHLGADGRILARNDRPEAPCAPRADAQFAGVPLCASCHNQHGTTDQWHETGFAAEGTDCNACHMPPRANGHSHVFPGGHDREMLLAAIRVTAESEDDTLVVAVENHGAGHNFPTEERSRAADVLVRFDDGAWERAHRFRLPYRNEPLPDTTLPHNATERIRVAVPAGATTASVRVWYRRTPFVGDDDPRSTLLHEATLELAVLDGPIEVEPATAVATPEPLPVELRSPRLEAAPAAAWSGPPLPPMALAPRAAELRDLAAAAAPRPDEDHLGRLLELASAALDPGMPERFAHRARRSLLEDPFARHALEVSLDSANPVVRINAARHLADLGDVAALPAILLRLKNEELESEPRVRMWLARALSSLGNDSALPVLVAAMRDATTADEAGQQAIAIATERGTGLSEAPTWSELEAALTTLHRSWRERGHVSDAPPPPDLDVRAATARHLANLEEFQLRLVDEARYVVARLGAHAVPLVREAVQASEPYVRVHALEILRDLGPAGRELGPAVIPLLGDEFSRSYAAEALGRIRCEAARPHLVARLEHPDLELRAKCAEALAHIADDDALAALRAIVADEAQPIDVRVHAAFAIACNEPDGDALAWLRARRDSGDYHASTLDELIARVHAR